MFDRDNSPGRAAVRHVTVGEDASGQRLDNFLLRELKGVPRARLYRAVRKGEVRVNRGRVRADYRLVAGDLVRLPPLDRPDRQPAPAVPRGLARDLARRVVYEDRDLLVLDKPPGLAVHGGSGLSFGLIECLREMRPEERYLELVHRLDRDTSGLVLLAKRASMLRELHRQLREKHVDKRYLALVAGAWPGSRTAVEAPLEKNVLQSGERMVRVSAGGKRALTAFSVLRRYPDATLVEARPVTGRTHQIRVHARHAGHPVLGDDKYADAAATAIARSLGLGRLFLHASALHFTLPEQGAITLEAPLGEELEKVLTKLSNTLKNK